MRRDKLRTAADQDTIQGETVPPGRLVDLAGLVVGVDTLASVLEERGDAGSELLSRGLQTLKRYAGEMRAAIETHLWPLYERPDAGGLRDELKLALRPGSVRAVTQNQAALFRVIFPWLKTRTMVFNGLFTGRVAKSARDLALVVEEESPAGRLNKLATIATVSGMSFPRKWLEAAAAEAGAPIRAVESVLTDASTARAVGEDLARLEARIGGTKQGTPEAAGLEAERLELVQQIEKLADGSQDPSTILAAAASAKPTHQYATETGKKLGHTPDQENAMMVRGRAIIAAGAGSGKTRVLASKVVFHIAECGIDPSSILASTFTNKAAAELVKRVKDYGAVIEGAALDGFGTTHSIAGKFLNRRATSFRRPEYIGKKEGWKQNTILRLAMEQVKMDVGSRPAPPHKPKGMWEGVFVEDKAQTPSSGGGGGGNTSGEYVYSIDTAIGYFQWAGRTWTGGAREWAVRQVPFLQDMRSMDPARLSPKQKQWLNDLFSKVKGRSPISFRVSALTVSAAPDEAAPDLPQPKSKKNKLDGYTFYRAPARQWFNLGRSLTREGPNGAVTPIPMGEFKNAISILKGRGLSPSQAWHGDGPYDVESDQAAVYAAYEWLKGPNGEPEFAGHGDMDDILIDTVTALIASPLLRRQMQSQYKVLLLDEAQDLNRVQHILFGLIAGYLDPATLEPKQDKSMTADTFALIGDDKQCVDINALISTPNGVKRAGDCHPGDLVLSYRNGELVPQVVNHAVLSRWEHGLRITTESGHSLTMTPNHRLWASEPRTEEDQVAVYLMFRRDMGFRVGVTNKGKVGVENNYLNSYGGRCFLEQAERLWVLDICQSREEALLKETSYSLQYGIPTSVFNGEHRGLNQERINSIFTLFGKNGVKLLEEKHLAFEYPHWLSQSYTKHDKGRHTVSLMAHGKNGTQVAMEWEGDKFDHLLEGMGVRSAPNDRRRLRRWFNNYREGLAFAEMVASKTQANLSHRMSVADSSIREITASGLYVGMAVPILEDGRLVLEPIVSIENVPGQFIDLDVGDASNFLGNQILTSNSIYEFRGADPEEFIDKSDLVPGGDDFKTQLLDTNFRSGQAIVDAANKLIAHNKKQVPMTCKANVDRNGMGRIVARPVDTVEEAAKSVAEEIAGMMESAQTGSTHYKDFGVAVRSNAEAYHYGLEMLKKGIPFKSNAQFFNDPNTKALIGWLTITEKGLNGPPAEIEVAIRDAVRAPYARLGQAFFTALEEKANGSWAKWLVDGGWRYIYSKSDMQTIVQHFTENLKAVAAMSGSPAQLVNNLMELRGIDGGTMREAMIRSVEEDDDRMAELAAESDSGVVTEEQIAELALAPVQPLLGLMAGKDNLTSAMNFVRKLKAVNEKISSKDTDQEIDRDAVTIGTMHSWKGLEVANMYVPMIGSKFPRAGQDGVAIDDGPLWSERRLAYVAITRAEQRCVILDIPHPKFQTTSQFISEACIPSEGQNQAEGTVPKVASDMAWTDQDIEELRDGDPFDDDMTLVEAWEEGV